MLMVDIYNTTWQDKTLATLCRYSTHSSFFWNFMDLVKFKSLGTCDFKGFKTRNTLEKLSKWERWHMGIIFQGLGNVIRLIQELSSFAHLHLLWQAPLLTSTFSPWSCTVFYPTQDRFLLFCFVLISEYCTLQPPS